MDFKAALKNTCFCLCLTSGTKDGIIQEMVDMLAQAGKITDKDAVLKAVMDRERKMSTGMQHGVAIPHGKSAAVGGLVTAFGLKKEGIDFSALDGNPSRIFVMTVSSPLRTGPHLQYLSEMSRLLSCPAVRDKVMEATTADAVIRILLEE